jgi:hypothetical protein
MAIQHRAAPAILLLSGPGPVIPVMIRVRLLKNTRKRILAIFQTASNATQRAEKKVVIKKTVAMP